MFNVDNPFWNAIGKVCDMVILNLLFIVCCIPVITIGASVTALYTATRKLQADEGGASYKVFFRAFKSNFKQATALWLILFAVGAMTAYNMYLMTLIELPAMGILRYVFFGLLIVWIIITSYTFPVQSKFENPVKNTLKNAVIMGFYHLLPWTLIIVVLNVLPWVLMFTFQGLGIVVSQLMIWIGFSAIAGVNTLIFERIFQQHLDAREEE